MKIRISLSVGQPGVKEMMASLLKAYSLKPSKAGLAKDGSRASYYDTFSWKNPNTAKEFKRQSACVGKYLAKLAKAGWKPLDEGSKSVVRNVLKGDYEARGSATLQSPDKKWKTSTKVGSSHEGGVRMGVDIVSISIESIG